MDQMTEKTAYERFADHVLGDDDSELARAKAERDYALHCLGREVSICAQTHAAFLAHIQDENHCEKTGQPCREWQKCGCYQEVDGYIQTAPEPTPPSDVLGGK
jgi:hypothetical protein